MAKTSELESAFDAAIGQARKCVKAGMVAVGGKPAGPYLQKLEEELTLERAKALQRGAIDKEWFQKTVRWLVEWVPETEPALIAAFGRIARATPLITPWGQANFISGLDGAIARSARRRRC